MKTIIIVIPVAALYCLASHVCAQESPGAENIVVENAVEIGRWQLSSGAEIGLAYAPTERTQLLRVDGTIARRFGQDRQVDAVAFAPGRSVCVLHVNEFVDHGLQHLMFLVLKDRPEPGMGHLQMTETLPRAQLMDVAGKRMDFVEMGSIVDYPLVDVYICMWNPIERFALREYEWHRWNLETGEWLGRVATEEAEAREAAARRQGSLLNP